MRSIAAAISRDLAVDVADAVADRRERGARPAATVATPSSVRRAPSSTDVDGARGLGLDLGDQLGDRAGRALGLLGELADLVGDDREARGPARRRGRPRSRR